jgi:flagellar protein FlaG
MYEKNTLSRVSEYKPERVVARPSATGPASAVIAKAAETGADGMREAEAAREKSRAPPATTLDKALGDLSTHVQNLHRSLQFSVDKGSGETVVRVVDSETKEVIRQIPSEEVLAMAARLRSDSGVLVSETV